MKKENIHDLSKQVEEQKDPYRRGVYHAENKGLTGIVTNRLDKGVKEKRGRREEVKILETRNKKRIEREVSSGRHTAHSLTLFRRKQQFNGLFSFYEFLLSELNKLTLFNM